MPNWCEGTLKIRGEKEDVINFLKNGITPIGLMGDTAEPEIEETEYHTMVKTEKGGFYLEGTRRGFIEESSIWYEYDRDVLAVEYKQAWGLDPEQLRAISEKFNIDLKIYAFEKGMEFNEHVEIHKGVIMKNEEIKFDDYDWECPCPNIGG